MNEGSQPNIVVNPRLRSLGDQLRDAALLIYKHWAPLLIFQGIMYFLIVIFTIIGVVIFFTPIVLALFKGIGPEEMLKYLFTPIFWIGIACIVSPMFIVMAWGTSGMLLSICHKGEGMAPIGETFKKSFSIFIPMAVLMFLMYLASFGLYFLLVFPAIILMLGLMLAMYVKAGEGVSIFKAFATSWHITKGYKWSIFGRLLLLGLMIWFVSIALAFASMIPVFGLVAQLVIFAFNFVLTPYMFAYIFCIYADIREVRGEVYSMSGGLTALMVIGWILGLSVIGTVITVGLYLVQNYII